jgi:hypothetical protein
VGHLPTNKGKGFAAVQEVNQFTWEALFFQGQLKKHDVRWVVFNDKKPGGRNIRNVFQAHSPHMAIDGCSSHSRADDIPNTAREWPHLRALPFGS